MLLIRLNSFEFLFEHLKLSTILVNHLFMGNMRRQSGGTRLSLRFGCSKVLVVHCINFCFDVLLSEKF